MAIGGAMMPTLSASCWKPDEKVLRLFTRPLQLVCGWVRGHGFFLTVVLAAWPDEEQESLIYENALLHFSFHRGRVRWHIADPADRPIG